MIQIMIGESKRGKLASGVVMGGEMNGDEKGNHTTQADEATG